MSALIRETFRFEPLRMRLPSEEIARRIADAVRDGVFRVGDRLPSERNLAEQFGVSRPTIREAAKILVEAGILSVRAGPGGGAFVASEHVPFDLLAPEFRMRPGEMFEILELRRLILPWTAQTAATHADDDDFDRMRDAIAFGRAQLARIGETVTREDAQMIVIASMRFDLAMARATRNGLLLRLMDMLLRWLEPLRLLTLRTRTEGIERAVTVVEETLQALESGDRDAIAAVIEKRLLVLEDALEQESGRMPRRKRQPGAS